MSRICPKVVRAAPSEQDAAVYLIAAFTGLRRGELLALRWRDVDFANSTVRVRASYAGGALTTPESGKVRSVPLAPDVASALAKLSRREWFTGDDDLVFPGEIGEYVDGSALRRRYMEALQRAGLRPLRFHDLRHTFGTQVIGNPRVVDPAAEGVDGPRRHRHDHALPALRAARAMRS